MSDQLYYYNYYENKSTYMCHYYFDNGTERKFMQHLKKFENRLN